MHLVALTIAVVFPLSPGPCYDCDMKELQISIPLPEDIPFDDEGLRQAQRAGSESAVIKLWEAGHLSTREAAERLQLSYYDFLEFLGGRGIPLMREISEPAELLEAFQELRRERAARSSE